MHQVTQGTFRTPRGRDVTLSYREDTNDYNVLRSCLTEDEYRLAELDLSGTALDIGAHIGGVTIALAVDNPDLHIVSVEAVPPNIDLLKHNLAALGIEDRVTVIHAAAGKGKTATVQWAFEGHGDLGSHNAFVGNALLPVAVDAHEVIQLQVRTLASLVKEFGPFTFAKVDCEGCEYPFLQGTALRNVALIRGEEHHGPLDLPGFDVTYEQDNAPRGFEAVRK